MSKRVFVMKIVSKICEILVSFQRKNGPKPVGAEFCFKARNLPFIHFLVARTKLHSLLSTAKCLLNKYMNNFVPEFK